VYGAADLAALESVAVPPLAGAGALQDQGPLELGRRAPGSLPTWLPSWPPTPPGRMVTAA